MIDKLITQLATKLTNENARLVTAESCTGGLIAKYCTDLAGSSDWFDRGFVTYSNQAKADMLNVEASVIEQFGAVSESVVLQMVEGAIKNSQANYAIAVSGIAGPGGGSEAKPVGTVWIAWSIDGIHSAHKFLFDGDRASIREQTTIEAIKKLITH